MSEAREALRLGEALAAMRRERGLSQAEAGSRIGMTSQGWGFYETGKRSGLFRPDIQRKLTSALDATPEDLMLMAGTGVAKSETASDKPTENHRVSEGSARSYEPPSPVGRQTWRLDTDDMAPWAFSGVVLDYVPNQWPRRDQGCIAQFSDGKRIVRLYVGSDADTVTLKDACGTAAHWPRAQIVSLSAVTARREEG